MKTIHRFLLLTLVMCWSHVAVAQAKLEIYGAWYGVEGKNVDTLNGKKLSEVLKTFVVNNTLVVPANLNQIFGKDPYPGVKKELAVQVGYNQGRDGLYNLRQYEGGDLVFPGIFGKTFFLAAPDGQVSVNAVRYGVDATPVSSAALDKVKKNMKNGYVYIPGDMNKFFGGDPAQGQVKSVAVNVTYKGQTFDLRQAEGQDLIFPGQEGSDYLRYFNNVTDAQIKTIFNANFYKLKNPDVHNKMEKENELWDHYINYGIKEGRDPNPAVSINAIRVRYPAMKKFFGDDYKKYIQYYIGSGGANGVLKSAAPEDKNWFDKGIFADQRLAYFDPDYYFMNHVCNDSNMSFPKGKNSCATPRVNVLLDVPALIDHYINKGAANNLQPNNIPMGQPQSANGKESMRSGDWLGVDEYLISRDRSLIAVLQADGNFAVYRTDHPSKANAGNFASFSGFTFRSGPNPDTSNKFFIYLGTDGHLCTFKGKNPSDNKGQVYCMAKEGPVGRYFLRLEGTANGFKNLTIRTGDSVFNAQQYFWDFLTNKPASPGPWDKALDLVKAVAQCN